MTATTDRFTHLNARWLAQVVRDGFADIPPVESVEVQQVPFTGATTDMARLRITYTDHDASGPTTLIAKLRGVREVQRQMDQAMGLFEREARFYATFVDKVPVRTPRCWSVGDGDTTPLLFEDLGNERMGDQMQGMSLADAEATIDALANLHATFWNSELLDEPWLAAPDEGGYATMIGRPARRQRRPHTGGAIR